MLQRGEVVQDLCTWDPFFQTAQTWLAMLNSGVRDGGWPVDAVCGGLPEVVQDFVRQQ